MITDQECDECCAEFTKLLTLLVAFGEKWSVKLDDELPVEYTARLEAVVVPFEGRIKTLGVENFPGF